MDHLKRPITERRLSDGDLERVLERALQLDDARASELTLEQVREICAELGVSAPAIEQALSEHLFSEQGRRALQVVEWNEMRRLRGRLKRAALLFGAFAVFLAFVQATTGLFDEELLPWVLGLVGVAIPLSYALRIQIRERHDKDASA